MVWEKEEFLFVHKLDKGVKMQEFILSLHHLEK